LPGSSEAAQGGVRPRSSDYCVFTGSHRAWKDFWSYPRWQWPEDRSWCWHTGFDLDLTNGAYLGASDQSSTRSSPTQSSKQSWPTVFATDTINRRALADGRSAGRLPALTMEQSVRGATPVMRGTLRWLRPREGGRSPIPGTRYVAIARLRTQRRAVTRCWC
jgi:hypothetical protein